MTPKTVAEKPVSMQMDGYEMVDKIAMPSGTTARVLVPKHWIGKRVRCVRLDE
jgi:putative transposon-encoded protein